MVKKFPYGYDVNAYIDKAFEQYIDVPATNTYSCDWYLEIYRIRKHELGGYSAYVQAGNRSAGGSRTSSYLFHISNCLGKNFLISISNWFPLAPSTWAGKTSRIAQD